jgi:hypothetical protein
MIMAKRDDKTPCPSKIAVRLQIMAAPSVTGIRTKTWWCSPRKIPRNPATISIPKGQPPWPVAVRPGSVLQRSASKFTLVAVNELLI